MRHHKIRIYKGTAAACVAAVALSNSLTPAASAQPAPPPPPAAMAELPPPPSPEQVQQTILQLIDLSRTAIAFTAEGLRIAFEALNMAEQMFVTADNNYLIAEAEHGADSPEAVAADARRDITHSRIETAGLQGDEEAAVVNTPESEERRQAASVAPALDAEDADTDRRTASDAPAGDLEEAIQKVRDAQEDYTRAAQAERDLLKRSDANAPSVQELRAAAEETRLAEEALTEAIDELEEVAGVEAPAIGETAVGNQVPAPDMTPVADEEEVPADEEAEDEEPGDVEEAEEETSAPAPTTDTPTSEAPAPATSSSEATPPAPVTTTVTQQAPAPAPTTVTQQVPAPEPQEPQEPTAPEDPAPPADPAPEGQDEEDGDAPESVEAEYNQLLGGPDGLFAKEQDAKEALEAANKVLPQYGEIDTQGRVKDLAPFWEFLAHNDTVATAIGEAIGTPLEEAVEYGHSGFTGGDPRILVRYTPGTKMCVEKEPGRINDAGYGNIHCRSIFDGSAADVAERAAEWSRLRGEPDSNAEKAAFIDTYVSADNQDLSVVRERVLEPNWRLHPDSDDSRRLAVLNELADIHEYVQQAQDDYDAAVAARTEVTDRLPGEGLTLLPNAATSGADVVVRAN